MKTLIAIAMLVMSAIAARASDQTSEKKVTVPIQPLANFAIVGDDLRKDVVLVEGSIVDLTGDSEPAERLADAMNVVHIECYPSSLKICIEALSRVEDDQFLTSNIYTWGISSATRNKIEAHADIPCASDVLTIDRALQLVYQVRTVSTLGRCALPTINGRASYQPPAHPIVWMIVDGMCLPFMDSRFSEWLKQRRWNGPDWDKHRDSCKKTGRPN